MSAERPESNGNQAFSTIRTVDYNKPVFLGDEQLRDLSAESTVFVAPIHSSAKQIEDTPASLQFSTELV